MREPNRELGGILPTFVRNALTHRQPVHPIWVMRSHTITSQADHMVKKLAFPIYEIRLRGVLGGTLLGAFPTLTGTTFGAETVLSGEIPDQAALYGVLSLIESLGLELLAVQQVAPA
jgi:hypothetical protein